MKRFLYTAAVVCVAVAAQAQTPVKKEQLSRSELKMRPEGATETQAKQQEPKKDIQQQEPKKAAQESAQPAPAEPGRTRMAINEKGVPAAKQPKAVSTSTVPAAASKKAAAPGQPLPAGNH